MGRHLSRHLKTPLYLCGFYGLCFVERLGAHIEQRNDRLDGRSTLAAFAPLGLCDRPFGGLAFLLDASW